MALTPKHERFCIEYVVDHNGTQAAIRAGYSEHTAGQQAHRLLKNAQIHARIAELDARVAAGVEDEAQDVLRDALETFKAAKAAGQFSAAVSALNLRARRHKEFSEKHEDTTDVAARAAALSLMADLTTEQLRALAENARS